MTFSSVFFFFLVNIWKCWRILVNRIEDCYNFSFGYRLQKMRVFEYSSWPWGSVGLVSTYHVFLLFAIHSMTKHFVFSEIEFFIPRYEETDKLRTSFKVARPSSVALFSGHSFFHVGEFCFSSSFWFLFTLKFSSRNSICYERIFTLSLSFAFAVKFPSNSFYNKKKGNFQKRNERCVIFVFLFSSAYIFDCCDGSISSSMEHNRR